MFWESLRNSVLLLQVHFLSVLYWYQSCVTIFSLLTYMRFLAKYAIYIGCWHFVLLRLNPTALWELVGMVVWAPSLIVVDLFVNRGYISLNSQCHNYFLSFTLFHPFCNLHILKDCWVSNFSKTWKLNPKNFLLRIWIVCFRKRFYNFSQA